MGAKPSPVSSAKTLRDKRFFTLVASDIGSSSPKTVSKYINAFAKRLAKELNRGNSVSVKCLGKFKPAMIGGSEISLFGKMSYIEPRLSMVFSTSDEFRTILNSMVMTDDEKKRLKNKKLTEEERISYGITRNKRNMEDMFEVIKEELKNLSDDDCLEDDEDDNIDIYEDFDDKEE